MDFATFARDYGAMTATLIVGVVGFAGVIGAQFLNAYLARRQRREAIEHERRALRTALVAELTRAKGILQGRADTTAKTPPGQEAEFFVPTRPMTHVYDRLTDKLGLLKATEVGKVVEAYEMLRELPLRLRLLERKMKMEGGELDPDFIKIDGRQYRMIEISDKYHAATINEAIDALKANLPAVS